MGKRGPPPRKGKPIAIRFEKALEDALRSAADENHVTLTAEIIDRLNFSITNSAAYGDGSSRATDGLLAGMRCLIENIEKWTGCPWSEDGFTRDRLADAVRAFVLLVGPNMDDAAAPPSFPAVQAPSEAARREIGNILLRDDFSQWCAEATLQAMGAPLANNERGAELGRLFSTEQSAGKALRSLIRPKAWDRNMMVVQFREDEHD